MKIHQKNGYESSFELPIHGATGFAPIELSVKEEPKRDSKTGRTLSPGEGFTILKEEGNWWYIDRSEEHPANPASGVTSPPLKGWVEHQYCFINLPDVIPSIVYKISNASSSEVRSSGVNLPHVTGQALYQSSSYNQRLQREQYISPALYATAKKVNTAQQIALSKGDTLVLYEAFRPWIAQRMIVKELTELANINPIVYQGLYQEPWGIDFFIHGGTSLHQIGVAVDVCLAKINAKAQRNLGSFTITEITDYTEYTMPTPIHELSNLAVVFVEPLPLTNLEVWKTMPLAPTMNEWAILLQSYMTQAGLYPLESEWWHFEDAKALEQNKGHTSKGDFVFKQVYSYLPNL